jgi:triacylglycerol lipase
VAFPLVGGLEPIQQTGVQIACFVQEVQDKTGVAKIDLVGHSKGVFLSLYIPKIIGLSLIINKIIAIIPSIYSTTFTGLYKLAILGRGLATKLVSGILDIVSYNTCSNLLPREVAILALNNSYSIT